ncbi:MAG: deoxyribose-phosphate aldolase [Ferruginibacter sp.]
MNIASSIDHTFLQPTASIKSIEQICDEARKYHFRAVCVPPLFVKRSKQLLDESQVRIATVVGFPFGYSAIEAKLAETILAIVDGADEIEVMLNLCAVKNADWQYLVKEIGNIMPVIKTNGKSIKIIFETGCLNETEIRTCCDIYGTAGINAVKTSTGFSEQGATIDSVKLLRKFLADAILISASGSVNTYFFAKQLLDAGAKTICTENSVEIFNEALQVN